MTQEELRLMVAEGRRQCELDNMEVKVARSEACAGVKAEAKGM